MNKKIGFFSKRPKLRFGLAFLFFLISICAGFLAGWRYYEQRAERDEMRSTERIREEEALASAAYDAETGIIEELTNYGVVRCERRIPARLAGHVATGDVDPEVFERAVSVSLTGAVIHGLTLKKLRNLCHLECLCLHGTDVGKRGQTIGDEDIAALARLTSLKRLYLGRTDITNEGVRHLRGLRNLEVLFLDRTQIFDDGLAHLKELKNLRELSLQETKVVGPGLAHLTDLDQLRALSLRDTQLASGNPDDLRLPPALERLDVSFLPLTNEHLKHLDDLKDLRWFALSSGLVTDEGLAHLKNLRHIEYLNLSRTNIHGEGLAHLSDMVNLRFLLLTYSEVTDIGMVHLAKLPGIKALSLRGTEVTDASWQHFLAFSETLEQLDVRSTKVGVKTQVLVDSKRPGLLVRDDFVVSDAPMVFSRYGCSLRP